MQCTVQEELEWRNRNMFNEKPEQYYHYAVTEYDKEELSKAIKILEEGIKLYPEETNLLNLLGLCHHLLCHFDKAKGYWHQSISLQKEDNEGKKYLDLYQSEGFHRLEEAYKEAEKFQGKREYKKAINIYNTIFQNNTSLVGIPRNMAQCYLEDKAYKEAREYAEITLLMDKSNEEAEKILRALEFVKTTKKKKGVTLGAVLLAVALATGFLVNYYQLQKRYAEDKSAYEQRLEELSQKALAAEEEKRALAEALEKEQEKEAPPLVEEVESPEETIEEEAPLEETPEEPQEEEVLFTEGEMDVFRMGLTSFNQGAYEEAKEAFLFVKNHGEIDSYISEAVFFLASTYRMLEELEKALENYEFYRVTYKGENYYEEVLYHYGLLLEEEGEILKAQEVLRELQEERPNSIYNNSVVQRILEEAP